MRKLVLTLIGTAFALLCLVLTFGATSSMGSNFTPEMAMATQNGLPGYEAGGLLFLLISSIGAVGLALRGSVPRVHRPAP